VKLVSYLTDGGYRAGVVEGDALFDAWQILGEPGRSSLRSLIAEGRLDDLAGTLADGQGTDPFDGPWRLGPPIPDPDKIICIGLNYRAHAEEFDLDIPEAPTVFAKFRNALVGTGETVTLPAASAKVDFEAEVAFVIGSRASEVAVGDALDHVAGYTLLNDLSARDLQFLTPQWMPGKVFDGAAPCGPWLVTPDEAGADDAIDVSLTLNGEEMQSSSTADLIFSVPELVSRLSHWMTLEPGDIVSTGTPSGVGSGRKPRVWLGDGDRLVVSSSRIGALETTVVRP
jgi:2-keto-4-pentenoate hydratase/2-oxohepta-3-ene-1,7-dioic acid hydratase in catechol pathway